MESYSVLEDIYNYVPPDDPIICNKVKVGCEYLEKPRLNTLKKSTYVCIFNVEPAIDTRHLYDLIQINEYLPGKRYKTKKEHIWEGEVEDTIYNNLYFKIGRYPIKIFTNGKIIHLCNTRDSEEMYIAYKIIQYISDLTGTSYSLELNEEKSTAAYSYKILNIHGKPVKLNLDQLALLCCNNPNIRPNYNNVEDGSQLGIQLILDEDNRKNLPFLTLTKNGSVTVRSPNKYACKLNDEFWKIIKQYTL